MTHDHWIMLGVLVGGWLVVVLVVAYRYPEKPCWWCKGAAFFCRLSPIMRTPVRRRCGRCVDGWRDRWLSRKLGRTGYREW